MLTATTTVDERGKPRSPYLRKLALAANADVRAAILCAFNAPVPVACLRKQIRDGSLRAGLIESMGVLSNLYRVADHGKTLAHVVKYIDLTISEAWRGLMQHGLGVTGLAQQIQYLAPEGSDFYRSLKPGVYRLLKGRGFRFAGLGKSWHVTHGPCVLCENEFDVSEINPNSWLCDDCYDAVETAWLDGGTT